MSESRFSRDTAIRAPWNHQLEAASACADALAAGMTRILVKQPTGTGKTFTARLVAQSDAVREAIGHGGGKLRVLFIANRHRLLRQAQEEFAGAEDVEMIPQSAFSEIPKAVLDAGWDIAIIDEAHHEAMMSIQLQLDNLMTRPIIGFTADDERGDGFLLKFETVICRLTERQAAEQGYIEKVGVNTILDTGGADKSELAKAVVDRYATHMGNTIVFFRTEAECQALAAHMRSRGLDCEVLTGTMSERELDDALDRLACGEIQFLVNCQRIGEGVDARGISDVLLCRQFSSAAEKRQFIGRAIRRDSPCAAWEFQNPIKDSVAAKSVVGMTKYERLIYHRKGEWHEQMLSGEDATWGRMSALRKQSEASRREAERRIAEQAGTPGGEALSVKSRGIDTNTDPLSDRMSAAAEQWRNEQLSLFGEAVFGNARPEPASRPRPRRKARRRAA